eukprot:113720_1
MADVAEDNKDIKIIFDTLKRIRDRGITDTKELTWQLMYHERQNENNNNNNNDEKQDENKKNNEKQDRISQLTNTSHNEMCRYGHGGWWMDDKENIGNSKCIMCVSMNERKYCMDCCYYDEDRTGKDYKDLYPLHIYCKECRITNAKNIKNKIKMNKFKAAIIRNE